MYFGPFGYWLAISIHLPGGQLSESLCSDVCLESTKAAQDLQ